MEVLKVLIAAKTRRKAGACIGGITPEGRSLRLVAANTATDEHAGLEYSVGEVWEIEAAPPATLIPPHVENVVVGNKRLLGFRADAAALIEQRMPPIIGDIHLLYAGLLQHTAQGGLYLAQGAQLPAYSTCFWKPDRALVRDLDGVRIRYRYPTADGGRTLTFVGFQDPLDELPAGALLRVSLAHWWRPAEKPAEELRCYAQLSGWFLPNQPLAPPAERSTTRRHHAAPAAHPAAEETAPVDLTTARATLKRVFGFEDFRPLQAEIISSLLRRQDALAVLPTGAGKSLCFQLPALLWDGLTVVVSPLISLMQDQVDALRQMGAPAIYLNSSLHYTDYLAGMDRIRAGAIKLLYVAPETLVRPEMLALLDQAHVECITIDEAHCVSQWGHDFRPEYRQLEPIRRRYPHAVCLALTATAAPRVQRDIRQTLGLAGGKCFIASFDRPNLNLCAQLRSAGIVQLKTFLDAHPGQAGIVYCNTRRQVMNLEKRLQGMGYRVLPYHAGLDDKTRTNNQRAFARDEVQIIVATVAFGMGIDKSNVRFVVHYELPPSLENYYQEIGRAGRDGLPADCLLLYTRGDLAAQSVRVDEGAEQERAGRQARLQAMMRYAQQTTDCRRRPLLAYLGESYPAENCGCCDICRHGPEQQGSVDVTQHALTLFACVQQTNERFGIAHVIQVLRGSQSQKVLSFYHDRLMCHGSGRNLPEKTWKALAQQLIQQGYLEQEMEHGTVALTDKARALLRGGGSVQAVLELEKQTAPLQPRQTHDYDVDLFEKLRQWRREAAERDNVPAYVVLSDRTLIEMAAILPQTEQMLLGIHGVGAHKLNRFGAALLALIRDHCATHSTGEPSDPLQGLSTTPVAKERTQEIGNLLNAGFTIAALQEMYRCRLKTIIHHLDIYVAAGGTVDPAVVLAASSLAEEQRAEVTAAFTSLGLTQLAPIFEAFGGRINYEELRIVRIVATLNQRREGSRALSRAPGSP